MSTPVLAHRRHAAAVMVVLVGLVVAVLNFLVGLFAGLVILGLGIIDRARGGSNRWPTWMLVAGAVLSVGCAVAALLSLPVSTENVLTD